MIELMQKYNSSIFNGILSELRVKICENSQKMEVFIITDCSVYQGGFIVGVGQCKLSELTLLND